jgi:hypothetical protein
MNTIEILKSARALIADEKNWTTEFYARAEGAAIFPGVSDKLPAAADCFCSIGSIAKAADMSIFEAEGSEPYKLLTALAEVDLYEFNDTQGFPNPAASHPS